MHKHCVNSGFYIPACVLLGPPRRALQGTERRKGTSTQGWQVWWSRLHTASASLCSFTGGFWGRTCELLHDSCQLADQLCDRNVFVVLAKVCLRLLSSFPNEHLRTHQLFVYVAPDCTCSASVWFPRLNWQYRDEL